MATALMTLTATGYHGHCAPDYAVGSTICQCFLCGIVLSTQEVFTVFSGHWTWENWPLVSVFPQQALITIKNPCPGHTAESQGSWTDPHPHL